MMPTDQELSQYDIIWERDPNPLPTLLRDLAQTQRGDKPRVADLRMYMGEGSPAVFNFPAVILALQQAIDRGVRIRVLTGPVMLVNWQGFNALLAISRRYPEQVILRHRDQRGNSLHYRVVEDHGQGHVHVERLHAPMCPADQREKGRLSPEDEAKLARDLVKWFDQEFNRANLRAGDQPCPHGEPLLATPAALNFFMQRERLLRWKNTPRRHLHRSEQAGHTSDGLAPRSTVAAWDAETLRRMPSASELLRVLRSVGDTDDDCPDLGAIAPERLDGLLNDAVAIAHDRRDEPVPPMLDRPPGQPVILHFENAPVDAAHRERLNRAEQVAGALIEPLYPGTEDADARRWYVITAPTEQEALLVLKRLRPLGVDATLAPPSRLP